MENGPDKCKLIHSDHLSELVDKFTAGLLSAKLDYRDDLRYVEFVNFTVNRQNFEKLMGPRTNVVGRAGLQSGRRYAS
jgi:hypothetical protein